MNIIVWLVFLFMAASCPVVSAQEVPPGLVEATDHFQQSLQELRQSVDDLAASNERTSRRNEALKEQLTQLRLRLGQLQEEERVLNKAAAALKEDSPKVVKGIRQAQAETVSVLDHLDQLSARLTMIAEQVKARQEEEREFAAQLDGLSVEPAREEEGQGDAAAFQDMRKEKLKLMKMIFDSKKHQVSLQTSLLAAQQESMASPSAQALARKAELLGRINRLQEELVRLPPVPKPVKDVFSEEDLSALEGQLKGLQRNHDELAELVVQLRAKSRKAKVSQKDRMEQDKLEASIKGMSTDARNLKMELDGLRSQMVELDKRKIRLESMLRR